MSEPNLVPSARFNYGRTCESSDELENLVLTFWLLKETSAVLLAFRK